MNRLEKLGTKRAFFLFSVLFAALHVAPRARSAAEFDHSHKIWTLLLQKSVTVKGHASVVNYKILKSDPTELHAYLRTLESVSQGEFGKFSNNEKLAFLINAYNAFTIKLILGRYPAKSIKHAGEWSLSNPTASPWKTKFFTLLGERRHLDNIEHDMIRKSFNEPRIHFAVVCASVGCPALRNEAFVAVNIEKQLEDAAQNFLSDKNRNRYLPEAKKLEVSAIFKWYGSDFTKKYGSLEAFLAPRITMNPEHQTIIFEKKAATSYLDYDWSLNEEK